MRSAVSAAAAAVVLSMCLSSPARACFWFRERPYPVMAFGPACPPPVFRAAEPCPCPSPAPGPCPVPGSPQPTNPTPSPPPNAAPTPAPPSASIEPPLADPSGTPEPPRAMPPGTTSQVKEALYSSVEDNDTPFFDTYIRPPGRAVRKSGAGCVVCFQNLTGRKVSLNVNGERRDLAAGDTWRVEPPRQFVWRMEGRPAQSEAVSTNLVGLEIVLRR